MAYVFAPKWLLNFYFFLFEWMQRPNKKLPDRWGEKKQKLYWKLQETHLWRWGCRSIQLLDILRRWLRMHTDSPGLRPSFGACVYLESYSWGEGREQQSSNRVTQSLFLVLFAVGSFRTPFLSSPLRIKSGCLKKRQKGAGPEENKQIHTKKKSDVTGTVIFPHLCKVTKSPWPECTLALAAKVVHLHSKC